MKKIVWIIKKAISNCYKQIILYIIILSLSTLATIALNLINKDMVNALSESTALGRVSSLFVGLVIGYMLLYFFNMASGFLWVYGNNYFRLGADEYFHKIFMIKTEQMPQESFFNTDFMEKYSFVRDNTNKISSYIGNLLNLIFSNIGTIAGSISIFIVYEPSRVGMPVIVACCSVILNGYVAKKEYELDKTQIKEQRQHDYYKDILSKKEYAKELRIYKYKNYIYEKWNAIFDKLRTEKFKLTLKKTSLGSIQTFVFFFIRIVAIIILIIGIKERKYNAGVFVMLFGLIHSCTEQVNNLIKLVMTGVYKDTKYLKDYYDYIMPITNDEIRSKINNTNNEIELKYGEFRELIAENISYTYPCSVNKAIHNLSFTLKKGEIVSILGYNGSGKTTLSKLLCGALYPQSGTITLNGITVSETNRSSVFSYFGIAPQEFSRFSLAIKEYVGIGRIEKIDSPEELNKAYKKAELESFLDKYENGDMTILGKEYDENGVDLSGGEWQRLVIASAYMGEPEVLILDEPTASIDPLREMDMIKHFRDCLKGKTAILISHRIGFARLADRIVMMQDGMIAEQGTHEELLALDGYYASIFHEQKKLYEEESSI